MLLREAVSTVPDRGAVRRVAIALGATTAIAIAGAIVVCGSAASRIREQPLPTIQIPRFSGIGLVEVPPADPEDIHVARSELAAFAYDAYPRWAATNPARECPDRLLELNTLAPKLHAVDPWGTPYQFLCGRQYGMTGVATRSAGPDRFFDTPDDLSSR